MGQFKRARLSGSDELFRPTRPAPPEGLERDAAGSADAEGAGDGPEAASTRPPTAPVSDKLSVELNTAEVKAIVDALQLARFPERQRTRPTMVEFERLGELQDRLRRLVAE